MTTEEQTKQDLLVLIQGRNQRIAELELQVLGLSRNQCECKEECKKEKPVFGEDKENAKSG
tara:strand:+ start:215 stop:397 length:183 start_codon:yes stop_codon:yes gene_type:complete